VVLSWIAIARFDFLYRLLSKAGKVLEYAIVMGVAALLSGASWWGLGLFPGEGEDKSIPNPEVTINQEAHDYYLAVRNRGGQATFHAEIEVLQRPSMDPHVGRRVYPAYWEQGKGPSTEIVSGLQDRL
jgi:hypothetical protein